MRSNECFRISSKFQKSLKSWLEDSRFSIIDSVTDLPKFVVNLSKCHQHSKLDRNNIISKTIREWHHGRRTKIVRTQCNAPRLGTENYSNKKQSLARKVFSSSRDWNKSRFSIKRKTNRSAILDQHRRGEKVVNYFWSVKIKFSSDGGKLWQRKKKRKKKERKKRIDALLSGRQSTYI